MCAGDGRGEHDQQGAGLAAALQVQDEAQGPQGRQGLGELENKQTNETFSLQLFYLTMDVTVRKTGIPIKR